MDLEGSRGLFLCNTLAYARTKTNMSGWQVPGRTLEAGVFRIKGRMTTRTTKTFHYLHNLTDQLDKPYL